MSIENGTGNSGTAFDPILLEIFNNKVAAIADEMYFALQRASRSTYVKEGADFGTALIAPDGSVFGYPPSATCQFLIDLDCAEAIRAAGPLEEGDVVLTNDPYTTDGLVTHLPDIHVIMPYFHDGRIVAYGWCFIHCTDVGGRVPSSISPSSHDIFQEGLRIPPLKLCHQGVYDQDLVNVIETNCRMPDMNMGDIRAMVGGMRIGAARVADIIAQYGVETLLAAPKALQDYTAEKARTVLRLIPDGTYEFWDYLDDDLVTTIPLRVRVRLTVKDGTVDIDVSGTDPQVMAAYNVPTMGNRNYWLSMRITTFMTTHDPSLVMNAGLYRYITATNPPGTVMHAEFPDAVGIRHATARRLNDAMTGAILKAVPDRMAGPSCGSSCPFVLAEHVPGSDRRTVQVIEPMKGGMGAIRGQDGVEVRDATLNNMKNHPIETIECDAGAIVREYDIRADSGGPGRWRGGVGQVMTVEVLRDGGTILARGMERLRFQPWGFNGGRPAARFRAIFNRGQASERDLPKIDELPVNRGDTLTIMMPGGSGYGDPLERDPASVAEDVRTGFVTTTGAARDYGVAVDQTGRVDAAATNRLRSGRPRDNRRAFFDFGPEREAWESVFDDATMLDLNRRLAAVPKPVRQQTRRAVFERTMGPLPVAGSIPLNEVMTDPDALRAKLRQAIAEIFPAEAAAAE